MKSRHPTLTALGLRVQLQRKKLELTQEALAEKAELDPTYISGIERGVRNPSILSLGRVAAGLGVSLADLCKGVDR